MQRAHVQRRAAHLQQVKLMLQRSERWQEHQNYLSRAATHLVMAMEHQIPDQQVQRWLQVNVAWLPV